MCASFQAFPRHACQEYLANFNKFGFREDRVPQLEDMAHVLKVTEGHDAVDRVTNALAMAAINLLYKLPLVL